MANLRGYINDTVTILQVDDTTGFPTNGGLVLIESELVRYAAATDKALLGCERGYNSTTPVAHEDKTPVVIQATSKPLYQLQEYQGSGAPTDHKTGIGFAFKGTRYTDVASAAMYINNGDETDPVWQPFAEGTAGGAAGPENSIQLSDGAGGFTTVDASVLIYDDVNSALKANILICPQYRVLTGGDMTLEVMDGGNLTLESDSGIVEVLSPTGLATPTLTNPSDGSNLAIKETQGANILISNEASMGGSISVDADADLSLASENGAVHLASGGDTVDITANGHSTFFNTDGTVGFGGTVTGPEASFDQVDTPLLVSTGALDIHASVGHVALYTLTADPVTISANANDQSLNWVFDDDGSLTLAGDLDVPSGGINLSQRMTVQSAGNFIAQSSTFTNLYLEGGSGIELIPASGGIFVSHSTGGADACAVMHFEVGAQGVILPRMDTTTRDSISSPSEGLIIYNTTTHALNFYNGSAWAAV